MLRSIAVYLAIALCSASAFAAPDVVSSLSPRTSAALEVARMEMEHEFEEMRQAIRLCREGKYEAAAPTISKFSSQNDIGANYIFAKMHFDGLGVEKSAEIGFSLLQRNIEDGHVPSMIMMGAMKETDAPAEAILFFKRAAALNDPTALVYLGRIYEQGLLGARANPKLAIKQYEKVQATGHPAGDFHMARCYDEGIGVSPDALQSSRLFMKSALAGVSEAQVIMARRYYEGKGLEADPIAAFGWLTRAAQSGSTEAMVLLGQRYEFGDVIKQDLNVAGQLYSTAARMGDASGIYRLGLMYLNGVGTDADPVRAFVLFDKAKDVLPAAREALDELATKLTPEQLQMAKQKIAEEQSNAGG